MIQEHIEQIAAKLQGASGLPEQTKADLLEQLSALRSEVDALSQTHAEDVRFRPVPRESEGAAEPTAGTMEGALEGLTASVEGLESSHPELTALVNRLALTLSNMGI